MNEQIPGEDTEDKMDFLFDHMDNLYWAGKFEEAEAYANGLDLTGLSTTLLVSVLSITLCVKDKFKDRAGLVLRVESRLRELVPDRVNGITEGLR